MRVAVAVLVVALVAAADAQKLFTIKHCSDSSCTKDCITQTLPQNQCFGGDPNYPSQIIQCGPDVVTQVNWANSTTCSEGYPITFQWENTGSPCMENRRGDALKYTQLLCPDADDFVFDLCATNNCGSCTAHRVKEGVCMNEGDRSAIYTCIDEDTIVARHFAEKNCNGYHYNVYTRSSQCVKSLLFPGYTERVKCPKKW